MPLRSDWSDASCPIARTLDILGDPWSLLILREIFLGNHRFDTLRERLDVADTVLSRRLRALIDAGIVERVAYSGSARQRYDYTLTQAGQETLPVLHALARWGEVHRPREERMGIECTGCGNTAGSADWCTTCQAPLTAQTTAWRTPNRPGDIVALAAT
jgi:DNA-binding HxlR family transcriptional regulator